MNVSQVNALISESFEYTDAFTGVTETIELQLKRMSFSISSSAAFKQAMNENDLGAMAEILSKLIGGWNLDADGAEFPPTAENISLLPIEFVGILAEKVFARLFPNPKPAKPSLSGSEPAATLSQAQAKS